MLSCLAVLALLIQPQFIAKPALGEQSKAVDHLVMQLKLWESRYRTDMVNEVLTKLFNVDPDHVYGLEVFSRYQMRLGKFQEAQWAMEKIRLIEPNNPAVSRLRNLLRLETKDKQQLQQARILALGGRINEALQAFEKLFGGPPPSPDLAREYWQMVYKTGNGKRRAFEGLKSLAQEYPDNVRFRLAYIEIEIDKTPFDVAYIEELALLAKDPNINLDAIRIWRSAVGNLDPIPSSVPYIKDYLNFNPTDNAIHRLLAQTQGTIDEFVELQQNPFYQAKQKGIEALASNENTRAEIEFNEALKHYPKDPEVIGGLGYVAMRKGIRLDAIIYFKRARKYDPDNQGQWNSLIQTNRFYRELDWADQAMTAGKMTKARNHINRAEKYSPGDVEIDVYRGTIASRQGKLKQADKLYRKALRKDPLNGSAIRGLLNQYTGLEQREKAMKFIAGLRSEQQSTHNSFITGIKAQFLQQDAQKLTSPKQQKMALLKLEQALKLTPNDPWLRSDIAKRTATLGNQTKAVALYDDLIDDKTRDADLLYSNALFMSSIDEDDLALQRLAQIPRHEYTQGIVNLQQRLTIVKLLDQAEASSTTTKINSLMNEAEALAVINNDFYLRLANSWQRQNNDAKALVAMESYLAFQNTSQNLIDADTLTDYADLLIANNRQDDAIKQLQSLATSPAVGAPELLEIANIYIDLSESNDNDKNFLSLAEQTFDRLPARAKIDKAAMLVSLTLSELNNNTEQVIATSEKLLARYPDERATRLDLVELLKQDPKNNARAQIHIDQLAGDYQQLTYDQQVTMIDHMSDNLDDSKNRTRIQGEISTLLAANPLDPDLYQAAIQNADIDESPRVINHKYQQAIITRRLSLLIEAAGLDPVNELSPTEARQQLAKQNLTTLGKEPLINQALMLLNQLDNVSSNEPLLNDDAFLIDDTQETDNWQIASLKSAMVDNWTNNNDYLEIGFDWSEKSGSSGQSKLSSFNIPIEARFSIAEGGSWFFRVEPVLLHAGRLNMDNRNESELFGTVLLCDLNGTALCPTGQIKQKEVGMSVAVGIEKENWKADIGTIPLGFEIIDWVGGFQYSGDLGEYYYSANLSKRPISSSLLSFSGQTDPNSGRVWGGATTMGVDLGFGYDQGEALGVWSSFGYHKIKGKNVQNNTRKRAMGGVYYRLLTENPFQLTIGLNVLTWAYDNDLSEYSFGQGGYYSPQSYASISIPIDLFGRIGDFSYLPRIIPSGSITADSYSLYYPTDNLYQSQAGQVNSAPFYGGDDTRSFGIGMSYQGAVEWRFAPRWTVGATFAIEKADFYEPSHGMIYLRYSFEPTLIPVNTPPKPVLLYQDF